MRRASLLVALAVAALSAAAPATATADQPLDSVLRSTPLAGHGGWAAWSRFDDATGRYALVLRAPDGTVRDAPVPSSGRPFDVSLGPDVRGRVVAVYRACGPAGCDVRMLQVADGADRPLVEVSAPRVSEGSPAIWGARVAFTRRIRGCDVPHVKDLRSLRPARRLRGSGCLAVDAGHIAVRGRRVLVSAVYHGPRPGASHVKRAVLRLFDARTGRSRVLARQSFGEEPSLFGQVALDAVHAYSVRHGVNKPDAFVRVRLRGGRPQLVRANVPLKGGFARSSAATSLYQQGGELACTGLANVPCPVVRSPHNPFGSAHRALIPELSVAYHPVRNASPHPQGQPEPYRGDPLPVRGRLTRTVVAKGAVVRVEPLAGVTVELLRRHGQGPERFERTGLTAVTGADGRYEIVVPAPLPREPWYTAVAATRVVETWAGRGTVGTAHDG